MYHDAMLQESNENCSIITDSLELLTKMNSLKMKSKTSPKKPLISWITAP